MKRFLALVAVFSVLVFAMTLGVIVIVKKKLDTGNYFGIDKNVRYLFLGQSHMECAFNDTLIAHSRNMANSGEACLYTYLKAKKLVENNPGVQTVFLVYALNSDKGVWADDYLSGHYPKYSFLMSAEEYGVFLPRKTKTILNLEAVSLSKNFRFLTGPDKNYIDHIFWGKFRYHQRSVVDSLIGAFNPNDTVPPEDAVYDINLRYLFKTVDYLKSKHIRVVLIRTPFHPLAPVLKREKLYQDIRKEKLADVAFWDFVDFPLKNSERADFTHLNHFGAEKLSNFFEHLLSEGILDSVNQQEIIHREMEDLRRQEIAAPE